jgi:NADH pyrophosphatase NudC (nudix superfamily)
MRDGGYRRACTACAAEHFPRTDPVVIMLPTFGDEALVGRNVRFINGLFSAFAGFVEPGETMEEAVKRELREETGLAVGAVRYHRSQPWPFPSALMLGCFAGVSGSKSSTEDWAPVFGICARDSGYSGGFLQRQANQMSGLMRLHKL